MIPSRARLTGWKFGPISAAADMVSTRGAAIEQAGHDIESSCEALPALRAWDGPSHAAATSAFGRARGQTGDIGKLADRLVDSLTQGYWTLTSAKDKLLGKVAEIEGGGLFLIHDHWAITLRPMPMTRARAKELFAQRDSLQEQLNPLVTAMGQADDSVSESVQRAARVAGFEMRSSSIPQVTPWLMKPEDDVPDPSTLPGQLYQRSVSEADASVTVAETTTGVDSDGQEFTTLIMQDGSRVVRTEIGQSRSAFFSHPALTTVGGGLAGAEQISDNALKKELPTLTKNEFQNLKAGTKFGGYGLGIGIALYDVATAGEPEEKCQAAISGLASAVGGTALGAAGGLVPIPVVDVAAAGAGTVAGAWLFGFLGSELGRAVCYDE
ncbi:hypothetical protein JTZ10_11125 [Gordonia rubripertincta]|uniref:WXG100 family type VII secretion target n=1 Tax=Gordonia rubripertincta TaxID=36822 RepID=A0AAW4G4Y9_GORRU|nr:hypothetical protein [Gordonia rubripertincta]